MRHNLERKETDNLLIGRMLCQAIDSNTCQTNLAKGNTRQISLIDGLIAQCAPVENEAAEAPFKEYTFLATIVAFT